MNYLLNMVIANLVGIVPKYKNYLSYCNLTDTEKITIMVLCVSQDDRRPHCFENVAMRYFSLHYYNDNCAIIYNKFLMQYFSDRYVRKFSDLFYTNSTHK